MFSKNRIVHITRRYSAFWALTPRPPENSWKNRPMGECYLGGNVRTVLFWYEYQTLVIFASKVAYGTTRFPLDLQGSYYCCMKQTSKIPRKNLLTHVQPDFLWTKRGGGKAQKRRAMHASTYLYMEAKLSTTEICSQVTTVVVVHTCMPPLLSDKVGSEFHPTRAICYLTVSVNIRYGCTRYSITPFEASLDAINSMEGKNVEPKTKMTAS